MLTDHREHCQSPALGISGEEAVSSSVLLRSEADNIIQVLWRHGWIIIGLMFVALVAGFLYLAKATPIYTSSARIYVEQNGPRIMGDLEKGVMTGSYNYLYTQAELIKATPILSEALKTLQDQHLRTFSGVDNRLQFLKKSIKATVGRKDDILQVSFDSPYPVEAANIVNTVVDEYLTYHHDRKQSTATEVLRLLQNQKTEFTKELTDRLQSMIDFKDKHEAIALQTGQNNMMLDRLTRLSDALTEAHLETLQAKSYYEAAKKMIESPDQFGQFVEAQRAQMGVNAYNEKIPLKVKLEELEERKADRLRQVNSIHPSVEAVETEIQQIKAKMKEIDQQFALAQLATLEQHYLTAKKREEQLAKDFEEQRQQALQLSREISEYTLLHNNYEQTEKTIDILDNRIKELNVTENAGVLNITILEVARPAEKPSAPQRARVMGLALILGLMLGGGLALGRDLLDYRIRSVDEVMTLLHSPTQSFVLGSIPTMPKRLSLSERGQRVHIDSTSIISEAFRTIRTSIFFSVHKDKAKVIQITSPMQGEGKSTLTSNLAIAMAQNGQRVLILDADFRRPKQHIIFRHKREPGLSGILAGIQKPSQGILKTPIERLSLMPCGPEVPNPAEMLDSKALRTLIEKLKGVYDRVLIDSTPVLPVADASIVAAMCDATILVIRANKSTRKAMQQAAGTLQRVGGRFLGAIVNDVSQSKRGGYDYGYAYKSNGKSKKQQNTSGQHSSLSKVPDRRSVSVRSEILL